MAEDWIDPLGVTAMATATSGTADLIGKNAQAVQATMDGVADLCPGEPRIQARANSIAGNLSEIAGWAQQVANHFVSGQESLQQILTRGYWLPNLPWDKHATAAQNVRKMLTSDEFAAMPIGLSTELAKRYRVLTYPGDGASVPDIPRMDLEPVDDVIGSTDVVKLPSGLLVPAGSSADPYMKIPEDIATTGWKNDGLLTGDPEMGEPPAWAKYGGKGLFVAGAGLALHGSWADQWDADKVQHPDWSTGHRVADAAYNTVTVGGGTVAGAWAGAEAGGELGATIGSFVGPEGTVIGGVVGGLVGGFVGSKVGKAVGSTVKHVASDIGHAAKKVWDSIF